MKNKIIIVLIMLVIIIIINFDKINLSIKNYNSFKEIEKLNLIQNNLNNDLENKSKELEIKLKTEEEWQKEIEDLKKDKNSLDKEINEIKSDIDKQQKEIEEIKTYRS